MNSISSSLVELAELKEMLGLADMRSIKKWCKEHKVPVIKIGNKLCTHNWTIEIALLRLIRNEAFAVDIDGYQLISAIVNDDKEQLIDLWDAPADNAKKRPKKRDSVQDIIDQYKTKTA